jgi:hypothetical protein
MPQCKDLTQRIQSVQAQLEAAEVALEFPSVASLGTQLQALRQQSAQLLLSEEDYLTLPAWHADLVRRVMDAYRELMKARDYAALGPLSAKLKELKAMDLSGIAGTSHESDGEHDPVVVSSLMGPDDDGESDPVIVKPARQG